jgi:hypothetical protein
LGVLSVMVHSWVDYPLQDPAIAFLWFAMAGALTRVGIIERSQRSRKDVESSEKT